MQEDSLFPVGRVAGPDDVVDREPFIDLIVHELISGQSVMIAGPRRIGKTSVAYEILRRLEQKGCLTADMDLFFISSMEEFATRLFAKIAEHRWGPFRVVERTWKGFLDVLQNTMVRRHVGDLEIEVTLPLRRDAKPEAILEAAFAMAESIAAKKGKRFVILFDEFQDVDRLGGADLIRRLRSIFQRQQHCTYLFLGSRPTMLKTLFSNRRQAFYRFAVQNDLPPVPDAAWRKYLVAKFSSVGMEITPAALDLILNETGGHPYGVMQVANAAYVRATISGQKLINAELVSIVLNGILRQLHDTYAEQWAEITELKHLAEVAVAIAEGNRPYSIEMHRTQVSRSLDMLQRMAIIERTGRGEYRFVEPLFARWLLEQTR